MMTPERLARDINSDKIEPLYCLYGEEPYLMDEALQAIIERSLGDGLRDFNLDVFYAGSSTPSDIVDTIGMFPMMASRRVVVIKEIQNLKEKHLDALLSVVQNPIDTTTLIFTGSKVDQRKKFYKEFMKTGTMVKFMRPKDSQVPGWIAHTVERFGKRILPNANQLLFQLVGPNLMELHNEIQKVVQFVGDKEVIEYTDIESIVSRFRVESVFELANAVGVGDRATALTCLVHLLDHGENEVGVLALIVRHIRILLLTKEAVSDGLSQQQISARVGVPPFFLKQYIDQSRAWTRPQLERAHRLLLDTDRALKSAPLASHILLENFVVKSCDILETSVSLQG